MLKIIDKLSFQKKAFLHRLHQNLTNKICCLGSFFYLFLSFCNKSFNAKVYHKIRDMPM